MFDRLTSFSISNPPPTTKVVLVHHNGDKTFTTVPLLKRRKASKTMSSSHYRSSSPGGRRIANPARMSDSFYTTSNPYGSPRASTERVIPLSTTTYIGGIPRISDSRLEPSRLEPSRLEPSRLEPSYGGGRPRRSSTLGSAARPSSAHGPPRSRPAVIQAQPDRPPSPLTRSHNQDYYVAPANSTRREHTHKKVYSIDEGKSHLVADIDINTQPRSRDRRGSVDRNGYLSPASGHSSSHRNSYHLSGPQPKRKDHVDIGSGFSYTDPAGMYRDTEPRRRHRSGSVEDARPRPSSMVVESFPQSRPSARERGPPTSSALDRYNETLGVGVGLSGAALGAGLQRGGSLRDPVRAPTTNRLSYQEPISGYTSSQEHGHTSSHKRHSTALHQERPSERRETYPPPREVVLREPYDERRELRDADRSRPIPRGYEDRSVESRGFGIRAPSLDRYGSDRGSDESLRRRQPYLERSAVPPREDAAVAAKREQERRDYDYARELERSERERPRERERERERDRDYREPDRKDRDRPRDDQAYMSDRDRDRARPSRDGPNYRDSDRDRRDRDRYNGPPRGSAENLSGILPVAIGGLGAAAAAAYGAGDISAKNREREKERSEREKDRGHHSPPESDREDRRRRRHDREHRVAGDSPPSDRERERRIPVTTSDPPPSDRERERRIPVTTSEPSKQPREQERDRTVPDPPAQAPLDPDEEYRRRVQQAQREIGAVPSDSSRRDHGASEGSPDAEHRRRDRDRERERERPDRNDRSHYRDPGLDETPPPRALRRASPDETNMPGAPPSALDRDENAARANRVRIVDPPKEKDEHATVRGILRKPTEKFPEDPNPIREGVAPLKDGKNKDIPLDARWTKISRELVNPECLEEAKERFEEREDCVIVLRVLTKEDIQKLADRTAEIRYTRYEEASRARHDRRRSDKDHDRRERDEYSDHSEDEYAHREPRLLEGSAPDHEAPADFVRDRRRDRERNDREREPSSVGSSSRDGGAYMSGGL